MKPLNLIGRKLDFEVARAEGLIKFSDLDINQEIPKYSTDLVSFGYLVNKYLVSIYWDVISKKWYAKLDGHIRISGESPSIALCRAIVDSKYGRGIAVGNKYGRLTILAANTSVGKSWNYKSLCICECGTVKEIFNASLKSGSSQSCGCWNREISRMQKTAFKHGYRDDPIYAVWNAMRARCENEKNHAYKDYGARGISVCKEWKDFRNFINDMGYRPSDNHSIDRINNNGNYEPSNCRWSTRKEQSNNKRNNVFWSIDGIDMTAPQAAEKFGMRLSLIRGRIRKGKTLIEAINQGVGK